MAKTTPLLFKIYAFFHKVWRGKRMELFVKRIRPLPGTKVLDVGGFIDFWRDFPVQGVEVICLNNEPVFRQKTISLGGANKIFTVYGDALNLPYPDRFFSVGFSNSVIEHLGSWDRQKTFAREILRVGEKIWVQTPAYECPFEPHFLAPFFHWLPKQWQLRLARNFTIWGLLHRPTLQSAQDMVQEVRLLKKSEFSELFPSCEIITEKLLFVFPKSYIAVRN